MKITLAPLLKGEWWMIFSRFSCCFALGETRGVSWLPIYLVIRAPRGGNIFRLGGDEFRQRLVSRYALGRSFDFACILIPVETGIQSVSLVGSPLRDAFRLGGDTFRQRLV